MNAQIKKTIKKICRKAASLFTLPAEVRLDEPRLHPVCRDFGRGTPIDRYYIESFLQQNADYITGDVIEVAENRYIDRFGHACTPHIIHLDPPKNSGMLKVDLTQVESLPEGIADCFVCIQTFDFIFDVDRAVQGAKRLLRNGGVLLATVCGISPISRADLERWGDYWRFTTLSAQKLFARHLKDVSVTTYGNVFAAKAFLDGVSVEDIPDKALLDYQDEDYQVTIAIRAKK